VINDEKTPSLYNHIENFQDLRNKLAIYGMEQLYRILSYSSQHITGDEAIKESAKSYIQFARSLPGLYDSSLSAPDLNDLTFHKISEQIVNVILFVLEPYQLKTEEALHVVRGLRSILHGFASLEQRGGFGVNLNLDQSIESVIEMYLA
jgi:hypothetical protein